ncbi:MAG TPA: GNAT family N-acetyltransferase [Firmicutes bacterium]|mgnify:CR=1 FL=1|nr:GNAT family N-acetyltransferase [Bacillota bacterium]
MIQYRYYQPGDEGAVVAAWNQALPLDPITPKRFRNLVLLDGNFDPEGLRLAVVGGEVIGLVYAVRRLMPMAGTELEPANGWIPFFFVLPGYQRQQIATRLMGDALGFLKEAAREQVFFASYAPNYVLPGIDPKAYPGGLAFLEAMGFEVQYSPVAMDRSLVDFAIPEEVKVLKEERLQEGYTFEFASDADLVELIQFANNEFNPDWGRAIREGLLQGLPMEHILVARDQGKLVGFCMHGGYEGIPERFGPFGVDPGQRGKGLGKILLNLSLQAMRSQGCHGAWFLWTGETSAAGYLYKKTGFEVTRQFHVMKKTL